MYPVSCRMHLESLLTIGLYIRQDAFQLWARFLFCPLPILVPLAYHPTNFCIDPFFTKEESEDNNENAARLSDVTNKAYLVSTESYLEFYTLI